MSEHAPTDASLFGLSEQLNPESRRNFTAEDIARMAINREAHNLVNQVEANLGFAITAQPEAAISTTAEPGETDFSLRAEEVLAASLKLDEKRLSVAEAQAAVSASFVNPVPTQSQIVDGLKTTTNDQFAIAA